MRVLVAGEVLVQEEDGEAFLLHVDSGRYFGLNRAGAVVWNAVKEGKDPAAALAERWPDVPADVRQRDADALVEAMRAAGLVVVEP